MTGRPLLSGLITGPRPSVKNGPAHPPRHLGLIPDGGRRYARARGKPIAEGHRRSAAKTAEVFIWCEQAGIEAVTLFTLSTGNLARPDTEQLPVFVQDTLRQLVAIGRWRINPVGDLDRLPPALRDAARTAARETAHRPGLLVNLALAYTGREDIVRAVQGFLNEPRNATADAAALAARLTPDAVERHLSTAGQPALDLIIRTSGEQRLSGFMTWQAEQAELYFCPRTWPAFRHTDLRRALRAYSRRQRRFGR